MKPIVSTNKILIYIRRNPGLTAHQLYRLVRPYNKVRRGQTTMGSKLYKLVKKGLLTRVQGGHATSDKLKAWRYYFPA